MCAELEALRADQHARDQGIAAWDRLVAEDAAIFRADLAEAGRGISSIASMTTGLLA